MTAATESLAVPKRGTRSAPVIALAVAAVFAVTCFEMFGGDPGADIVPLWVAAKLWAAGMPEAIYAADTTVFTLAAPEAFEPIARADGFEGPLYPFIYPPLWAALLAPVTQAVDLAMFDAVFTVLNSLALILCPWLIWRAAPLLSFGRHLAAGSLLLLVTTVGLIPIMGNQLQIAVALLLALTMERSRNGGEIAAGVALGLAAALKLYPALFAILFLAQRQPRAFLAFVATGGALGCASLALCGWAPHGALLEQLGVISATVLRINLIMNVDALVAIVSTAPKTEVAPGLVAIAKSPGWILSDRIALVGYLAALSVAAWTSPRIAAHSLFWPSAFLGASLLGPLSWAFHYITPVAAAPLLLGLWPVRRAVALLIVLAVGLSLTVVLPVPAPFGAPPLQFWGSASLLVLWVGFLATLLRR